MTVKLQAMSKHKADSDSSSISSVLLVWVLLDVVVE